MLSLRQTVDRRTMLQVSGAALAGLTGVSAQAVDQAAKSTAFFVVSDTHFLAQRDNPSQLDEPSAAVNSRLIDTLNRLPGTPIAESAGGGTVGTPRGVIHGGDLIDTGDKNGKVQEQMQRTEWEAFEREFGLNGGDGRLKYPVFEVHGNHDGPRGRTVAIDGIKARNKKRAGVNVSADGLHYSWDWGPVHLVNLGIVVGQDKSVAQPRRYDPHESLAFLVEDLQTRVGDSGRPVILTHHIDILRYSLACQADDPMNASREWHPCDVAAYYTALKPYRIAGIFYGHTHRRERLSWNGSTKPAQSGLPLFNVDNSSHFHSEQQAFFYCEITPSELVVREYATGDRWQTGAWSPLVWRVPLAGG
jgi:cytolysin (calcineurin-like family phosphatase)